jgi:hypothetical protein
VYGMTVSAGPVFNIRTTVRFGSSSSPLRMENNAKELAVSLSFWMGIV